MNVIPLKLNIPWFAVTSVLPAIEGVYVLVLVTWFIASLTVDTESDATFCPYLSTKAKYVVGITPPLFWFVNLSRSVPV